MCVLPSVREILPLPDGGQVGLDWNEPDHLTASTSDAIPHVVILPGITGMVSCGQQGIALMGWSMCSVQLLVHICVHGFKSHF